jgi:pyrroline-5-carboxylate reductase
MMIGFIGGGKMAEALIKGIVTQGNKNIFVSELLENRRRYLETSYNVKTYGSNQEVAHTCQTLIIAVKPQDMPTVLDEIAHVITEDKIVISVAAGLTLNFFQKKLTTKKIVRAMPNTPVFVQEGMTALSFGEFFPESHTATIVDLFMTVGKVLILPEEQMNAISALSGSGPAFIALFLESLIKAGEGMGLANEQATQAALQTLVGTATLLKTGISPEQLCTMVASPGGMTIEGLKVFREKGLKDIVADALQATQKRGIELGSK